VISGNCSLSFCRSDFGVLFRLRVAGQNQPASIEIRDLLARLRTIDEDKPLAWAGKNWVHQFLGQPPALS